MRLSAASCRAAAAAAELAAAALASSAAFVASWTLCAAAAAEAASALAASPAADTAALAAASPSPATSCWSSSQSCVLLACSNAAATELGAGTGSTSRKSWPITSIIWYLEARRDEVDASPALFSSSSTTVEYRTSATSACSRVSTSRGRSSVLGIAVDSC